MESISLFGQARLAALAVLFGVLTFHGAPAASASEVADASCPGPRESSETNVGSSRFAQSFTAQHSGALTGARLAVFKEAGSTAGDWIVDILDVDGTATPINGVLASATVPDSSVPEQFAEMTATFEAPTNVIAGQQYALEFSRPASTLTGIGKRNGDDCAGQLFGAGAAGDFSAMGQTGADMVFSVTVDAVPQQLTVRKSGTGSGIVTATGIDCGGDCTETINNGDTVTLTAAPTSGSTFDGWSGCDSASGNTCTMMMSADRTLTASFTATERAFGDTGQRAAALKRCKKKQGKARRKKCKRKAIKLPV